jgi:hypothetical protein
MEVINPCIYLGSRYSLAGAAQPQRFEIILN